MRATLHNGRIGKDGVYNPRHNDRNFDLTNAEHIDPSRSQENVYWNCFNNSELTFEQAEKTFYEEHFKEHLDAQNERYKAQRHYKRIKNMDEYRTARHTCPEETILAIGNKDEYIPPKTLMAICTEFMNWEQRTYPGLHILNFSLHNDERGCGHIHVRRCWVYTDREGHEAISQEKVLERAGVPLLYPEKTRSRYNNRKQVFSMQEREKFFDICREYGLDSLMERQPRERSKSGQQLTEYQAQQAEKRARIAEMRTRTAEKKSRQIERETTESLNKLEQLQDFLHRAEQRQAFQMFQKREHERVR